MKCELLANKKPLALGTFVWIFKKQKLISSSTSNKDVAMLSSNNNNWPKHLSKENSLSLMRSFIFYSTILSYYLIVVVVSFSRYSQISKSWMVCIVVVVAKIDLVKYISLGCCHAIKQQQQLTKAFIKRK